MAYIYLGMKHGSNKSYISYNLKATIIVTKEVSKEYKNFEKVSYEIKYPDKYDTQLIKAYFGSYYTIYLYTGFSDRRKGNYVFGYFSPSVNGSILKKIEVYYSLLRPEHPLIISFTRRDGKNFNYSYESMKIREWFYASDSEKYQLKGGLEFELMREYETISKKKKLTFKTDKEKNENIFESKDLQIGKRFSKIILLPHMYNRRGGSRKGPFELTNKQLFKPNTYNTQIENNLLDTVRDQPYDGVIVYYTFPGGIALLVEFINGSSTKLQYVKERLRGNNWNHGEINYTNDKELLRELAKITSALNGRKGNYRPGVTPSNITDSGLGLGGITAVTPDDDLLEEDFEVIPTLTTIGIDYDDENEDSNNLGKIILWILVGSTVAAGIGTLAYYKCPRFLATLYRRFI